MPCMPTFPEPLLRDFVSRLERDAAAMEHWLGGPSAVSLRKVAAELTAMLDNPVHRWITVKEAAIIMKKSEETIRRWCRLGTAPFEFRQDQKSDEYAIWLASVPASSPVLTTTAA